MSQWSEKELKLLKKLVKKGKSSKYITEQFEKKRKKGYNKNIFQIIFGYTVVKISNINVHKLFSQKWALVEFSLSNNQTHKLFDRDQPTIGQYLTHITGQWAAGL